MMQKRAYATFGKRLRHLRLSKGISQEAIAQKLGFQSNSYVSDAESGKFIPSEDKMAVWAEMLGLTMEHIEDLKLEARIEELGIADPSFTMMFKDVPNMTVEEKQSIIRAYEAVLKARQAKHQPKR